MKIISGGLTTHLSGDLVTLATCWRIQRTDNVVLGFTDHDRDLIMNADGLGNVTYIAALGYSRTAIESQSGLSVDNLDVEAIIDDDSISEDDLLSGKYNYAEVKIFTVNWANLSHGILKERKGHCGQFTFRRDTFTTELRGLTSIYEQPIGRIYTLDCDADLGDARCKVDMGGAQWNDATDYVVGDRVVSTGAGLHLFHFRCTLAGTSGGTEPTWNTAVGGPTVDGTVIWDTFQLGLFAEVVVATVFAPLLGDLRPQAFTVTPTLEDFTPVPWVPVIGSSYFAGGRAYWVSGNNAGLGTEIKLFDETTSGVTLLFPPVHPIQVGDAVTLFAGCDKVFTTCQFKWRNLNNFRGFPFIPGLDKALRVATPPSV